MTTATAFLLAFPALFSIVNPLGMAFIFEDLAADLDRADRVRMAGGSVCTPPASCWGRSGSAPRC